jgi:hypothetical protein
MRESRTYGSVRGALSNERPYRDPTGRRFAPTRWLCAEYPGYERFDNNRRLKLIFS